MKTISTSIVDVPDLFYFFLKANNAVEKFNKNVKRKGSWWVNLKDLIASAFIWGETPEGYYYWSRLNDEWEAALFEVVDDPW